MPPLRGRVAQLAEQWPFKPLVESSSLSALTTLQRATHPPHETPQAVARGVSCLTGDLAVYYSPLSKAILAFTVTLILASCGQGIARTPSSSNPTTHSTIASTDTPIPTATSTVPTVPTLTQAPRPDTIESAIQRIFALFQKNDFDEVHSRWMADDFAVLYDAVYPPLSELFSGIEQWHLVEITDDANTLLNYSEGLYEAIWNISPVSVAIVDVEFDDNKRSFSSPWDGSRIEQMACFFFFMSPSLTPEGRWEIVYLSGDTSCDAPLRALASTPEPTPTAVVAQPIDNPLATPTPYQACPSPSPLTRLWVGGYAAVSLDPPLPNNVREGPGTNYPLIGDIQPGYPMEILDGPECANNWTWWKVRSLADGLVGWTAEGDAKGYWLIPCPPDSECGSVGQP